VAVANASLQALGIARGQAAPYTLNYGAGSTSLTTDFEITAAGSYINGVGLVPIWGLSVYSIVLGPGAKADALNQANSGQLHTTWTIESGDAEFASMGSDTCQLQFGGSTGTDVVLRASWSDGFNVGFYVETTITIYTASSSS
jgi:hypothetical protein